MAIFCILLGKRVSANSLLLSRKNGVRDKLLCFFFERQVDRPVDCYKLGTGSKLKQMLG